jgi:uncharacterized membrane protein YhaH (DUF805 family)
LLPEQEGQSMSATIGLREHFAKLLDFKGREDSASFWPYAALVFGIIIVAGMAIFIPMMAHTMRAMQEFAAQHPDQASIASGPGQYSISVSGDHPQFLPGGAMVAFLAVTFGLAFFLYAAAVVRRLHDRGKSGLWGLMPVPFILYSSVMMPIFFSSVGAGQEPDMTQFFSIFFSNMLYIVTLVALIVMLAGRSDPTHNRFDNSE